MGSRESSLAPDSIHQLPDEILQIIFRNLTFQERKNTSLVCRRWNENAMHCNEIVLHAWMNLPNQKYIIKKIMACKRSYKYVLVSNYIFPDKFFNKYSHNLEELKISSVKEYASSKESNYLGQLYRLKKLKRLILHWTIILDDLKPAKHICSSLRELDATDVNFENFANFTTFICTAFPDLTRLVLKECNLYKPLDFSNLPALEELVFECGQPFDCSLLKDLQFVPSLRYFQLYCIKLKGLDQIEPGFQLPHLKNLDITVRVYDCHLLRLTEIFPALISFKVAAREKYLTAAIEAKAAEKMSQNCDMKLEKFSNLVSGHDPDLDLTLGLEVTHFNSYMISYKGTLG